MRTPGRVCIWHDCPPIIVPTVLLSSLLWCTVGGLPGVQSCEGEREREREGLIDSDIAVQY